MSKKNRKNQQRKIEITQIEHSEDNNIKEPIVNETTRIFMENKPIEKKRRWDYSNLIK